MEEEGYHGARYMIEEGVLDGVDKCYALHCNNTYADIAGAALADALSLGSLRYPAGTPANVWDMIAGEFTAPPGGWAEHYSHFKSYQDEVVGKHPVGTFSARSYLRRVAAAEAR